MLTLGELFTRLSYGPLSNLYTGDEGDGSIPASKQASLIAKTNEALIRLHTRFDLSTRQVHVKLREDLTSYKMSSKYAFTNPSVGVTPYILDTTGNPFKDDLLKIIAVYSLEGQQYALNDRNDCHSVFTPKPDVLFVQKPVDDKILFVTYRAKHPKLDEREVDLSVEIDIPYVLEEALINYISSRVYSSMSGVEHVNKGTSLMNEFNAICSDVTMQDMVNNSIVASPNKFRDRGFV